MPSSGASRSWRAPGRVNIIGEHIDYLGGTVLPFACDLELRIEGNIVANGRVDVRSDVGAIEPFVRGVQRALGEEGVGVVGFTGTVSSSIPTGTGLSSSSALTAALVLALSDGVRPTPELLLRAERYATGVFGGLMDQTTILDGRDGHAILLDCASGAGDHIPIPETVAFVVIDTGTRRALSDGRYAQRRAEVEAGEPKRLRHASSEQRRVYAAVDALRTGDVASLGALLSESHASLRDDFEVSSRELDTAVEAAVAISGCAGARLVGAGFAGCVLAVVERGGEQEVAARFPSAFVVRAVDGAGSG